MKDFKELFICCGDGDRTHDFLLMGQPRYLLRHPAIQLHRNPIIFELRCKGSNKIVFLLLKLYQ